MKQSVADADVVFVPAHPVTSGSKQDVGFETRELDSGGQAAIAFTSLSLLVEALGQSQPWLAMPLGRLREVIGSQGVSQVAVDPTVTSEAWRWTEEGIRELEGSEG